MVNWLIDSLGLLVWLVTNTICIETSPDDVRRRGWGATTSLNMPRGHYYVQRFVRMLGNFKSMQTTQKREEEKDGHARLGVS